MSKRIPLVWGYHFLRPSCCLAYGDGRLVTVGKKFSVSGPIKLCENGLHASKKVSHALNYAPGLVLCVVRVSGNIQEGADKICGRHREVVWMRNVSAELDEFACQCTEMALRREEKLGHVIDPRIWDSISVKRAWMRKEAKIADLDRACNAAYNAVHDLLITAVNHNIHYNLRGILNAYNAAGNATRSSFSAFHAASVAKLVVLSAAEMQWQEEKLLELFKIPTFLIQ